MDILERLDRAARHFSENDYTGLSSPFGCRKWTRDDTRQLLEDAAKEIRRLQSIADAPFRIRWTTDGMDDRPHR